MIQARRRFALAVAAAALLYAGLTAFAFAPPPAPDRPGRGRHGDDTAGGEPHGAPRSDVTFDALARLAEAEVHVVKKRRATPCAWVETPGRFRCGPDAWSQVGPYVGRLDGVAERCLWVHPQRDGAVTEVVWRDVRLGAQVQLRARLLPRSGKRSTAHVRVFVRDRRVADTSLDDEWEVGRDDAELPPGPERGEVRLEVHAQKNDWRMVCVSLQMKGRRRAKTPRTPATAGRRAGPVRGARDSARPAPAPRAKPARRSP